MNKLRVFKIWPAFAVLSLVLIFSSCGNKDEDPVPTDDRDQFVSTFSVTDSWIENGIAKKYDYSMRIDKSTQDTKVILLSNFAGYSITIKANVSGNSFTIPQQTVEGVGYSGSGTISGSSLSFSYQQSDTDRGLWNVSATGVKM